MEKLVELGLTKSIGVSNFNSEQLTRLLANCKIKPIHNQVRQLWLCLGFHIPNRPFSRSNVIPR